MDYPRNPKEFTRHFTLDYYRRPRPLRRWKWMLSLVAALGLAGALAAVVIDRRRHTAFQAAPVSHAHAFFGHDCAACHDTAFATARRFVPFANAHSVSDGRCTHCHAAGRHGATPATEASLGAQATGCVECHQEHRGDSLTRLDDKTCVRCHAGEPGGPASAFAGGIRSFSDGHPEFGHWRRARLTDPAAGAFRFNHKVHMDLPQNYAGVPADRKRLLSVELERLSAQQCNYCHQPGADGAAMQPIRYADHCAACHPIDVPGAAAGARLPHPAAGQGAAVVHGALIDGFLRQIQREEAAPPTGPATEPAILRSREEQVASARRQEKLAAERAGRAEKLLFDTPNAGCQECHARTAVAGPDGLPVFAPPRQQVGRWGDAVNHWPALRLRPHQPGPNPDAYADARNRWFPLSRFDHAAHRVFACTDCHRAGDGGPTADQSTQTSDVLMPTRSNCAQCHNNQPQGARSDCLACHAYHDHTQQPSVFRETRPELLPRNYGTKP
jgi:hypothetical protein